MPHPETECSGCNVPLTQLSSLISLWILEITSPQIAPDPFMGGGEHGTLPVAPSLYLYYFVYTFLGILNPWSSFNIHSIIPFSRKFSPSPSVEISCRSSAPRVLSLLLCSAHHSSCGLQNYEHSSASVQAALTEYHRQSGLNNRHLVRTVLEAGKSTTKVPADLMSDESSLPGLQMRGERNHLSWVFSCKDTGPICEGFTLMTQLPPRDSTSKYYHIGSLDFNTKIFGDGVGSGGKPPVLRKHLSLQPKGEFLGEQGLVSTLCSLAQSRTQWVLMYLWELILAVFPWVSFPPVLPVPFKGLVIKENFKVHTKKLRE